MLNYPGAVPCRFIGFGHTVLDARYCVTNEQLAHRFLDHYLDQKERAEFIAQLALTHPGEDPIAVMDKKLFDVAGIRSRYITSDLSVEDLGAQAAAMAMRHAHITADQVDAMYVGRNTGTQYPSTAIGIKRRLSLPVGALTRDVQDACVGGIAALESACDRVWSGRAKIAIAVGVDRASELGPKNDWSRINIFGDGGGAVVVQAGNQSEQENVLQTDFSSDPFDGKDEYIVRTETGFLQRGRKVHEFVGTVMPRRIKEFVSASTISPTDIRQVFCHQPSWKTFTLLRDRVMNTAPEYAGWNWHTNVETHGNMSAACVLWLMSHAIHHGLVAPEDPCLSVAFGSGMADGMILWRYMPTT